MRFLDSILDFVWSIACFALAISIPCSWVTHVIRCILDESWILLILGAIVFPIGCVHGFGVWLGIF